MPRTLQHIQNELLVLQCQDGERDALEELIKRWQARLRRHAWTLTSDAEAVNDVCQESSLLEPVDRQPVERRPLHLSHRYSHRFSV